MKPDPGKETEFLNKNRRSTPNQGLADNGRNAFSTLEGAEIRRLSRQDFLEVEASM